MGISFQDGTVHERARITLVSIAADILLIRLILGCELPLQPGRESGSASAPQPAVQKDLDHIFRSLLGQHAPERLISAGPYVFLNILRV